MRKVLCLLLMLNLCACAKPVPLSANSMLPSEAVYQETSKDFYLKHRIVVGDFEYAGENREAHAITFSNFSIAVTQALNKGGYLTNAGNATYRLSGRIKEVKIPRCLFGSCESGSAIEYTLTNIKNGNVAYNELLVVPYTMECPVFMNDPIPYIMQAYTQTVGANIAQLIQVLNRKTSSNLK